MRLWLVNRFDPEHRYEVLAYDKEMETITLRSPTIGVIVDPWPREGVVADFAKRTFKLVREE